VDKQYIVQFLIDLGRNNSGHLFSPFFLLVLNAFKKNKIPEDDYETHMQDIASNNACKFTVLTVFRPFN
jgi:hypothetical protein